MQQAKVEREVEAVPVVISSLPSCAMSTEVFKVKRLLCFFLTHLTRRKKLSMHSSALKIWEQGEFALCYASLLSYIWFDL